MKGNPIEAYTMMASQLQNARSPSNSLPPKADFRTENLLSDLEYVAASQMYAESDRMIFTRALAAYTANVDIIPLARCLY